MSSVVVFVQLIAVEEGVRVRIAGVEAVRYRIRG